MCIFPDINECNGAHGCDASHGSCRNTDGSFECRCDDGYELNGDGATCDGVYIVGMSIAYIQRTNNC